MPLRVGVQGENLALLSVAPWHVGEHAQQLPTRCLGDERRMVQGMDQFSQAGRPQAVVPGQERLGRRLVGGLPADGPSPHQRNHHGARRDSPADPRVSREGSAARQAFPTRQLRTFAPTAVMYKYSAGLTVRLSSHRDC